MILFISKCREKPVKPAVAPAVEEDVWAPAPYTVFKIYMSARLCAAAWNIVGDCDETFNYWEPVRLLILPTMTILHLWH